MQLSSLRYDTDPGKAGDTVSVGGYDTDEV